MLYKAANGLIAIPIDNYLIEVTHIYHPRILTEVLHTFHKICDNEALILPGYSKIVEPTTTYRHHGPVDRGASEQHPGSPTPLEHHSLL